MLAVRLVLAAVFLVSAVAKAVAPRRTADAARDLGVPAALASPVAVLLPVTEVAVAMLLTVTPTVTAGGFAATALMAAFTAVIAVNLARGRRPACACFGALSSRAPIGPATLMRNAILLAGSLAVLVAALLPGACSAGCYDGSGARHIMVAGGLAVLAAIVSGAVLIHALSTTVGQLTARVRDLEAALGRPTTPRRQAVDLAALQRAVTTTAVTDLHGEPLSLTDLAGGREETLLVLMSARCSACERLRQQIRAAPPPSGLHLLGIIDRVEPGVSAEPGDRFVIVTDGGAIAEASGVQAFPSAVVLDAGLRPVGDILTGTNEIRRYLDDRAPAREADRSPTPPAGSDRSPSPAAEGAWQHA